MSAYADLELNIQRRDGETYGLELRFAEPGSDVDQRFSAASSIVFDEDQLLMRSGNPSDYGCYLAQQLFVDAEARSFFDQCRAVAQAKDIPLRVRLLLGPAASELHGLRWETLHLPGDDGPLLAGENMTFSRYLSSLDWRPPSLRPDTKNLRALLVIANPNNLAEYGLAEVKLDIETPLARAVLGAIQVDELITRGQATLENVIAKLHDGYDILYVVAHGRLKGHEPSLFLEKDDGATAIVSGRDLVTRIRDLRYRPRLVVLASCQSASADSATAAASANALAGLGPRLAEAGILAVIAMQGIVSIETVQRFTTTFFTELQRDPQIDHAMAVARGAVRDRPDWWTPVLFMRLKSGHIAYKPGFSQEREGLEKWPALLRHLKAGRCTPILGPGLNEWLLGSRQEIAANWSEQHGYPLDPSSRESLPQVAQYLSVEQDVFFVRDELRSYLQGEAWRRYGYLLAPDLKDADIDVLVSEIGKLPQVQSAMLPYRVLARLPLKVYITTNPGNLMADALAAEGKDPIVQICPWNTNLRETESMPNADPNYRPSEKQPLVYHLFGRFMEPRSVVVTEDNYFDYLIGATTNKDLIPPVVKRALTDASLLFLGFNLDEWDFRVLFRSLMNLEGSQAREEYAHVAAQIDPEQGRILEPEGARRFLQKSLGKAHVSIFWGSVQDFAQELSQQLP